MIKGLPISGLVGVGIAALVVGVICASIGWLLVFILGAKVESTFAKRTDGTYEGNETDENDLHGAKEPLTASTHENDKSEIVHFLRDGANMLVRSAVLQLSFLLVRSTEKTCRWRE